MPADSKVEHHLPPTASCPMDNGSWADEQGSGLTSPWPQKLAVHDAMDPLGARHSGPGGWAWSYEAWQGQWCARTGQAGRRQMLAEEDDSGRRTGMKVTRWMAGEMAGKEQVKRYRSYDECPEGKSANLRVRACGPEMTERTYPLDQRVGEEASGLSERKSSEVLHRDPVSGTAVLSGRSVLRGYGTTCEVRVMLESLPMGKPRRKYGEGGEHHTAVREELCKEAVSQRDTGNEQRARRVMLDSEVDVMQVCMQNAPVVCETPVSLRRSEIADEDEVCKQISRVHCKPRRKKPEFASQAESENYEVDREIEILIPLIPQVIVQEMLGGPRGSMQVSDATMRSELIRRILKKRAGTDGNRLGSVRSFLAIARKYAWKVEKLQGTEADEFLFPMGAVLAHVLIAKEDERARSAAKGARKGETVGDRLRDTIIFAAENLRWPIERNKVILGAAVGKAGGYEMDKAGTLPLAVKCHFEEVAAEVSAGLAELSETARAATVHYARSILAVGIDPSIRVAEGARVVLWPDELEPAKVIRGCAYIGKDSAPLNIFAPAEGFLGPYEWYGTYLNACVEGKVFPAYKKPRGSRGSILQAGELKPTVIASKGDIRAAFKAILSIKPLGYTDEEIKEMNLQGHSFHASPPEWARQLGNRITRLGLEADEELRMGFDEADFKALGNWLRDAGAKNEADVAIAAMEAEPAEARKAAARAALPGQPATRGIMPVYYGTPGRGNTRQSERVIQLRVRQRLAHTIRRLIQNEGGWRCLPRGQMDLAILS